MKSGYRNAVDSSISERMNDVYVKSSIKMLNNGSFS